MKLNKIKTGTRLMWDSIDQEAGTGERYPVTVGHNYPYNRPGIRLIMIHAHGSSHYMTGSEFLRIPTAEELTRHTWPEVEIFTPKTARP